MGSRAIEPIREQGTMVDRLMEAARRITETPSPSGEGLRPEQAGVYADMAEYLTDAATRPERGDGHVPMARIILPPRTGKTVIACKIAEGAGLTTTFIVPTVTLVEQVAAEFRRFLPETPVGVFCGAKKDLAVGGVNVTTYQILQACMRERGELPWQIAMSALVFADEGHHAMTSGRLKVLKDGFDRRAIRVALTATPDYSDERTLASHFPELIHEMTVREAMELDLLAPVRFWMAEVDEDATRVDIVAGDLNQEQLGRIMSAAPYFEAARYYRYHETHRDRAALICCATRQQAHDLRAYVRARLPEGAPAPGVILGETSAEARRDMLRDFEAGKIDTLINVGVLLEGWNSSRCKLLIDLAPSLSRVRAMQKFFRPLTRSDDRDAHILMIVPSRLPGKVILPLDLFTDGSREYVAGEPIVSRTSAAPSEPPPAVARRKSPIEKVTLVVRIAVTSRFEPPKLNPRNERQVRSVIESALGYEPDADLEGYQRFRWLTFRHPLFTGRGLQLLRYLGIPADKRSFVSFMARLYPDSAARRYIETVGREAIKEASCADDRAYLEHYLVEPSSQPHDKESHDGFELGWMAAIGAAGRSRGPHPDEVIDREKIIRIIVDELVPRLTPIERFMFMWAAECPSVPETLKGCGDHFGLSRERMRQISKRAFHKVRQELQRRGFDDL